MKTICVRILLVQLLVFISFKPLVAANDKIILRVNNESQIQEIMFLNKGMLLILVCNKYPSEQNIASNIIEMRVMRWSAVEDGYEYWDKENKKHSLKKMPDRKDGIARYIDNETRYIRVDSSIILKKIDSLENGKYPSIDKKLDDEWPFFDPQAFDDAKLKEKK